MVPSTYLLFCQCLYSGIFGFLQFSMWCRNHSLYESTKLNGVDHPGFDTLFFLQYSRMNAINKEKERQVYGDKNKKAHDSQGHQ